MLVTFATILYLALLSSQAAHKKHKSSIHLTHSEKNLSNCQDKIRGVNLGGWLVLEPWITPSIFEEVNNGKFSLTPIVDEYTYNQHVPREKASSRLEKYESFKKIVIYITIAIFTSFRLSVLTLIS